jgi:hypothetical protein
MTLEFFLRIGLVHIAQIAIFVLAVRVCRKRKESGFLALTIGLGAQALFALTRLLSMFGMAGVIQPIFGRLYWVELYIPLSLALVGWAMLGRAKNAKA